MAEFSAYNRFLTTLPQPPLELTWLLESLSLSGGTQECHVVTECFDTLFPSEEPTEQPSEEPTEEPTEQPTEEPSEQPSEEPTEQPSEHPTEEPTDLPSE